MSAKADKWMPFYVADYLRDTMHLTRDQHGAYLLLLMACWTRGGSLPNDQGQLAGIAKATPKEWAKLAPVILPFFSVDGAELRQGRVSAEAERAKRLSEIRKAVGSKGGRPRKQTESNEKPIGSANGNQSGLQTETPSQEPYGSTVRVGSDEPTLTPRARGSRVPIPDGFPDAGALEAGAEVIRKAGVELDVDDQARRFVGHAKANDRRMVYWLEAWLSWVRIEVGKAPKATVAAKAPPLAWNGPPKLRAAIIKHKGEPFAESWLFPTRYTAAPKPAVICRAKLQADRLRDFCGPIFAEHGVAIIFEKGAA